MRVGFCQKAQQKEPSKRLVGPVANPDAKAQGAVDRPPSPEARHNVQ